MPLPSKNVWWLRSIHIYVATVTVLQAVSSHNHPQAETIRRHPLTDLSSEKFRTHTHTHKTMAPTTSTLLTAAILFTSSVLALPQKVDTNMPVLPSTSQQVWWTNTAAVEEWNQWTVLKTASATATAAVVATGSSAVSSAKATVSAASNSVPYSNPFTIYTSMTNSLGVITGMPAVVTSQPTQAAVATVCSGCASVLSAQSSWGSMVSSIYSSSVTRVAAVSTSSAAPSQSASATRSSFQQASTGAAGRTMANSGAAILLVGAVAALL